MHIYHDSDIAKWAKAAEEINAQMALAYLASTYAGLAIAAITADATTFYMSLHSASPGTTGANEILGSSQAGYSADGYTGYRQALTFGSASTGVKTSTDTQTFALLATFASGIPYYGVWTAHDAGTYICGGATASLTGSLPSGASVVFTNGVVQSVQG
jgi:hypothetical protein